MLRRWSRYHNIKIRTISQQSTAAAAERVAAGDSDLEGPALAAVIGVLECPPIDPNRAA